MFTEIANLRPTNLKYFTPNDLKANAITYIVIAVLNYFSYITITLHDITSGEITS